MNWDGLKESMDRQHVLREQALRRCREIIQTSAASIRALHRQESEKAEELLGRAQGLVRDLRAELSAEPAVLYAGYVQDAEKEMVEAAVLRAMLTQRTVPSATDLGVDVTSYLHGAAEAASECRRTLLDRLRAGDRSEAERLMTLMEGVYDELIRFDYPDGLTGGLRRTTDALRAVVERTRSDLTLTTLQNSLIDELRRARSD